MNFSHLLLSRNAIRPLTRRHFLKLSDRVRFGYPIQSVRLQSTKINKKGESGGLNLEPLPETGIPIQKRIVLSLTRHIWPKKQIGTKIRVVAALGLLVGAKLLNVNVPFYFKQIVDSMNLPADEIMNNIGHSGTLILSMVLTYGVARFGATLFGELRNAIFATVAQKAIREVSRQTFDHIMKLDMTFHFSNSTGQLTRAIDRGCKGISYVLTSLVFHIVPIGLEVMLVGGLLSYNFGASFTFVTLATVAMYTWFTIRTTAWRAQFRRQANRADNIINGVATETLQNIESVVLFNNQSHQLKRYDVSLANYESASIKVAKSLSYLNSGQNLIFSTALTYLMYLTCNGISQGAMSIGDLILVNQLLFQLSVPLNFLGSVYRDLKNALLDMETLYKLQQQPIKIQSAKDAPLIKIKPGGGHIKFENVSFSYRKNVPILNNASFEILPGQSTAFVGPSGSGKSTILKLIFRSIEPQSGRILIDGQDIRYVDLDSLRRSIGVVPQETPLFNDTILNNVRFGNVSSSDEDCHDCIGKAELAGLIKKLPDGYNTVVGERGLMISGGERQRLSVARVLLKRAPINIFDEATSALDTETEQQLLSNISQNFMNTTSVFIAHRLRTVSNADKIIVLRNGSVQEEGSHRQLLLNPKSLYSRMWQAQQVHDDGEETEKDKAKESTEKSATDL